MNEPTLLDLLGIVDGNAPHDATPAEKFQAFHNANPHIYRQLESLAQEMVNRGRTRIGIRMLWETLRWNYSVSVVSDDAIAKLNNNHTPFYARMLLDVHPDWTGLFQLRERDQR